MAFQKQVKIIMNTHVANSGLTKMPAGMMLVFDSETGKVEHASSVQDRAAYHRFLMLRARPATSSEAGRPQEIPLRKKEQ